MQTKSFALGIGTVMLMAGLAACGSGGGDSGGVVPGGVPADVTTFSATAAGSAINLQWSGVADLKNYTLERKTTGGSYAALASPAANATGYGDTALNASTAYTYRLKTVNAVGSSAGMEASATTAEVPNPGAPANPDAFAATTSPGAVHLSWAKSSGALNYTLERKSSGAYERVAAPLADVLSYDDTNLTPGTAYSYRLKAENAAGASSGTEVSTTTPVIVPAAKTVLLVDDDASDNNDNPGNATAKLSAPDTTYQTLLSTLGAGYDTVVVKSNQDGPTYDQMKAYETVIWYTGPDTLRSAGPTVTDLSTISAYLDDDAHRAILISDRLFYCSGWDAAQSSFRKDVIGASKTGCVQSAENPALSGVSGAVTADLSLRTALPNDGYHYLGVLEPALGTASFLTVVANPDGTSDRPVTIASGHKQMGTAKSSTMIFVGFPLENIVDVGANSKATLMSRLLAY